MSVTPVERPPVESPLPPGGDPRAHGLRLSRAREAALTGSAPPVAPRAVIRASWRRMRWAGLDPAGATEVPALGFAELHRRREASELGPLLPLLRARLLPAAEAAGQVMVVVDPEGRVLWREGGADVRRRADALGFVEGSAWDEASVGTNAIGTSLVVGSTVHVHAAEHYAETHQPWTCAAAPLHHPMTGRLLGAVDLSGPAHTVHASTVALVDAVARLAELEVRQAVLRRVERLRSIGAPLLARLPGQALVVSTDGCTAAATGLTVPERIVLPDGLCAGTAWLPALGRCTAEALPGGWLLRLDDEPGTAGPGSHRLLLDLAGTVPQVHVTGPSGDWTHALTLRHAEILLALLVRPEGRSAAQLAQDLCGDPTRTVTVRAEVSRLRRTLGPLLQHQPYRIDDGVQAELRLPAGDVLPASSAPLVVAQRAVIQRAVIQQAVTHQAVTQRPAAGVRPGRAPRR